MYLLPQYRFAFLAVPATGSHAVVRALQQVGGCSSLGQHHDLPCDHLTRLGAFGFDHTWTVACTVRELIPWIESIYRKRIVLGWDYHSNTITVEWIKTLERERRFFYPLQRDPFARFTAYCTDIWRHESLQEDFRRTTMACGMPPTTLERINVTRAPEATWSDRAAIYVTEKYRQREVVYA